MATEGYYTELKPRRFTRPAANLEDRVEDVVPQAPPAVEDNSDFEFPEPTIRELTHPSSSYTRMPSHSNVEGTNAPPSYRRPSAVNTPPATPLISASVTNFAFPKPVYSSDEEDNNPLFTHTFELDPNEVHSWDDVDRAIVGQRNEPVSDNTFGADDDSSKKPAGDKDARIDSFKTDIIKLQQKMCDSERMNANLLEERESTIAQLDRRLMEKESTIVTLSNTVRELEAFTQRSGQSGGASGNRESERIVSQLKDEMKQKEDEYNRLFDENAYLQKSLKKAELDREGYKEKFEKLEHELPLLYKGSVDGSQKDFEIRNLKKLNEEQQSLIKRLEQDIQRLREEHKKVQLCAQRSPSSMNLSGSFGRSSDSQTVQQVVEHTKELITKLKAKCKKEMEDALTAQRGDYERLLAEKQEMIDSLQNDGLDENELANYMSQLDSLVD